MSGIALSAAIVGVENLDSSAAFYRDIVGLEASPIGHLEGAAFAQHWALPAAATARAQVFSMPGVDVGRVVLLEFAAPQRVQVRRPGETTIRGLWNLNFYVSDIRSTCRDLAALGFQLWSDPVSYEVSGKSGHPTEALFEGPDGVVINLVELNGSPDTVIGRVRAAADRVGRTRTGWSAVATTSHSVGNVDAAIAFYREVVGLQVLMDEVLAKSETNHFLKRPANGRTRAVFMAADHPFGKIALSHNLNYDVPDHVGDARAPNIGYLAQSFRVAQLDAAVARAIATGASIESARLTVDAWGTGSPAPAVLLRNPGSGALMQLVQKSILSPQ